MGDRYHRRLLALFSSGQKFFQDRTCDAVVETSLHGLKAGHSKYEAVSHLPYFAFPAKQNSFTYTLTKYLASSGMKMMNLTKFCSIKFHVALFTVSLCLVLVNSSPEGWRLPPMQNSWRVHRHGHRAVSNGTTLNGTQSQHTANLFNAAADDDFTCSAARPCRNGACCGASGWCGYGE